MIQFENVTEILKYLSTLHREILHSDSEKHFVSDPDESETSIDSLLFYPAVFFLEQGDKITGEAASYSMNTTYSLSVLDHINDTGDYARITLTYKKTKRILLELLNILTSLKRKYPRLLGGFSLNGIEITPVNNAADSLYGYIAEFKISAPYVAANCENVLIDNHNLY